MSRMGTVGTLQSSRFKSQKQLLDSPACALGSGRRTTASTLATPDGCAVKPDLTCRRLPQRSLTAKGKRLDRVACLKGGKHSERETVPPSDAFLPSQKHLSAWDCVVTSHRIVRCNAHALPRQCSTSRTDRVYAGARCPAQQRSAAMGKSLIETTKPSPLQTATLSSVLLSSCLLPDSIFPACESHDLEQRASATELFCCAALLPRAVLPRHSTKSMEPWRSVRSSHKYWSAYRKQQRWF